MTLREVPANSVGDCAVSTLELLLDSEWAEDSLESLLLRRFGRQALVYTAPYAFCMNEPGQEADKIIGDDVHGIARLCCTLTLDVAAVPKQTHHKFAVVEDSGETIVILRNITGLDSARVNITPGYTVPTVASFSPYIGLPLSGDTLLYPARFTKISEQPVYIPPQLKIVE
jgi:hypothetical protein